MKKISFLVALASIIVSRPAQSATFDSVVAFGDSLSDKGNLYSLTGDTIPPSPPYYQGRFSNGPVWVEDVAKSLGIPLADYALGGANTDNTNIISPSLPGLQGEIAAYVNSNPIADPNALYTVWAGSNDLLFDSSPNPSQTTANVISAVEALINIGAKNILVDNLPDLGALPWSAQQDIYYPGYSNYETALTKAFNLDLSKDLSQLRLANPGVNLNLQDIYTEFNNTLDIYKNNSALNPNNCITNAPSYNYSTISFVNGCTTNTSIQDQYFFWDDVHPTTPIHAIVAQDAINLLEVPEPSNLLGALTILGLGIGLKRTTRT